MDFDEIRRLTITALFSDDELYEQIVLKGGNAISLVYGYGSRGSLDLDFSIERDFPELDDTRRRIFKALHQRFSSAGLVVFDEQFDVVHVRATAPSAAKVAFGNNDRSPFVEFFLNLVFYFSRAVALSLCGRGTPAVPPRPGLPVHLF